MTTSSLIFAVIVLLFDEDALNETVTLVGVFSTLPAVASYIVGSPNAGMLMFTDLDELSTLVLEYIFKVLVCADVVLLYVIVVEPNMK